MKTKPILTPERKLELIGEIFDLVYASTESFREPIPDFPDMIDPAMPIGVDLAYLLASIPDDSLFLTSVGPGGRPDSGLYRFLVAKLPPDHDVFNFLKRDDE